MASGAFVMSSRPDKRGKAGFSAGNTLAGESEREGKMNFLKIIFKKALAIF